MFRSRSNVYTSGFETSEVVDDYKMMKATWRSSLKKLFSKKSSRQQPRERYQRQHHAKPSKTKSHYTEQNFNNPHVALFKISGDCPSHEAQRSTPKYPRSSKCPSFTHQGLANKKPKEGTNLDWLNKREEDSNFLQACRGDLLYSPGTAAYIPQHAATGFWHSTLKRPRITDVSLPATSVGVPTHINYEIFKLKTQSPSSKLDFGWPQLVPDAPSIETTELTEDNVNFDSDKFLDESHITTIVMRSSCARINSKSSKALLPQSSSVMDGILAKHQINDLHRSQSHQTTITRASNRKSIIDSVGEYIKPTRSETVLISEPGTGDNFRNEKVSLSGQEIARWQKVRGSIGKSLSRDRDIENDERAADPRNLRPKQNLQKRRNMPPSTGNPALKTYHQAAIQNMKEDEH